MNTLSELPLDPMSETLHNKIPNWDIVSEIVNGTSIVRRSARQVITAPNFFHLSDLKHFAFSVDLCPTFPTNFRPNFCIAMKGC